MPLFNKVIRYQCVIEMRDNKNLPQVEVRPIVWLPYLADNNKLTKARAYVQYKRYPQPATVTIRNNN